jgi:hypothetical protein
MSETRSAARSGGDDQARRTNLWHMGTIVAMIPASKPEVYTKFRGRYKRRGTGVG